MKQPAPPPGTPCYNCAEPLRGHWCHACGQASHDFHRSAWALGWETFENFFHADGRLWRTLGGLVRNPGRLTRDYLSGKRAPQIPPLRLFLVTLLIVFLAGGWATRGVSLVALEKPSPDLQKAFDSSRFGRDSADPNGSLAGLPHAWRPPVARWLRAHLSLALAKPADLLAAIRDRAQNFAFLLLPVSALLLALIFVFRRGFVLFDHLVFSMHSLSFQGLLISLAMLTGLDWLLWAAPVHLFAHLRGVYATGVIGTLVRMGALFVLSTIAFTVLLLALIVAGLRVLHA